MAHHQQKNQPNSAVYDRLAQIRLNLIERMWWTMAGLAAVALPVMVWRLHVKYLDPEAGSPQINLIFGGVCICMLALFPLRRRIPLAARSAVPVVLLSVSGVVSLFFFGAASTLFICLVQANFLISTLYTSRAGAWANVATTTLALLVGLGYVTGFLHTDRDLNEYVLLPSTWIIFLLGSTLLPTLILYAIGDYQRTIVALLQEAERATTAKTQFLAHMTHELRTPLAGVIGMLEMAHQRSHDRAVNHLLDVARDNAESLLNLVNDALDLSKIEAGKLTLQEEVFNLPEFLAYSLRIFALRAEQKGIVFSHSVDPSLPPLRRGDPHRLRQLLFNLVGNALKFTDHGSIRVEVQTAPAVTPADGGNGIRITVRDTGMGIDPQDLPNLFGAYVQANPAVEQRFGGTGLGLRICQSLAQAMGGNIAVESRLGEGSCFTVTLALPLATDADRAAHPSTNSPITTPAHNSHRLNVLLAEDTPTNQMVVMEMLRGMGHTVTLAVNGREALRVAGQDVVDVILMDLRMPLLDGLAATRLLRKGGDASNPVLDPDIYICALTANAMQHDQDAAQAAGMQDFLAKPVRQHALYVALQRAIDYQLARGRPLEPVSVPPANEGDRQQLEAWLGLVPQPPTPSDGLQAVFLQDAAQRQVLLAQEVAHANWPAVHEIAHAIKGAALTVSRDTLASAAGALEAACQQGGNGNIDHRQQLAQHLLRLLQQVQEDGA
ncbi:response regulator [Rhodoferax sp. AJA081-3]|uniref:sensor histidine kinase n=1 Tax=Rhodoferax sp. AJA081-3 TaxID=2752316 RepID=UPI001AE04D2C|nr:sensor histidine kinase [Rhodoferax sp. AJA081-3]QTN29161.1 response regulator [Rhodoferax sp. AJA081-3]